MEKKDDMPTVIDQLKQKLNNLRLPDEVEPLRPQLVNEFSEAMSAAVVDFLYPAEYKNSFSEQVQGKAGVIASIGEDRGLLYIEALRGAIACENLVYIFHRKTQELSFGFLRSINSDQLLTASILCRAIHELAAFCVYVETNYHRKYSALKRQIESPKILKELKVVTDFLSSIYYGSDFHKTGHKKIHIDTARSEYAKIRENESLVYSKLCDYVHPNYGSNKLYGTGNLTDLAFKDSSALRDEHFFWLALAFTSAIKAITETTYATTAQGLMFASILDRLLAPQVKIQNLFKPFTLKLNRGQTGLTHETAIDLRSSLNGFEQVRAVHDYLNSIGERMISKEIQKKDGKFFDAVRTEHQTIYFLIKVN